MLRSWSPVQFAALLLLIPAPALALQQLEPFPIGPALTLVRGPEVPNDLGGDDDRYNVWYFEIDPAIVVPDGTAAPDFYVHIFDGDCNPLASFDALNDKLGSSAQRSKFRYRLFGGPGASSNEELSAGMGHSGLFSGVQIDIDSDGGPNDLSLQTADPDDVDGNAPEDLRDQGFSVIGVDMDQSPGDFVNGLQVYKLVVDGLPDVGGTAANFGDDWNLYEVLASRDAERTDAMGITIYTYELTIGGKPPALPSNVDVGFLVPDSGSGQLDLQTYDQDTGVSGFQTQSQLATSDQYFGSNETFESGQGAVGTSFFWSSALQGSPPPTVGSGNGQKGFATPSASHVGDAWVYSVDLDEANNPFSLRLQTGVLPGPNWLPMRLTRAVQGYEPLGASPLQHMVAGRPTSGPGVGGTLRLAAEGAPPLAPGYLAITTAQALMMPAEYALYLAPPVLIGKGLVFDANGEWAESQPLPPNLPTFTVYSQVFAVDVAASYLLRHSNGVQTRIAPTL